MTDRKHILILCSQTYDKQPRVLRTIEALEKTYDISVAGISQAKEHKVRFIDLSKNSKQYPPEIYWHFNKPFFVRLPVSFYYKYIKQKQFYKPFYFEQQYWTKAKKADLEQLQAVKADLIISHGIDTLPLAVKLAGGKIPVVFNAHEYYPLEFEQDEDWLKTEGAKASYMINTYLPKCNYMFCVSELIQEKFQKTIKIASSVITNAANYVNQEVQKIDPSRIKIIHHGIALRERNIEGMVTLIDFLDDRYELNIMLTVAEADYYEELKQKFSENKRIHFLPAVPLHSLPHFLNQFDIGYYILPPVNFNTTYALPNKLFEYVQARLCLAFAPSPEMKAVIEKYEIGIISNEFTPQSIAEKIKALSVDTITKFKLNSHKNAMELSAENNKEKIKSLIDKLLQN